MANKTVNEHYVPQFYLKSFSFEPSKPYKLYCFDKGDQKTKCIPVNRVGCENNYFGNQNFENIMSILESEISKAFRNVCALSDSSDICDLDRAWISIFIALELVRVKDKREEIFQSISSITSFLEKNGITPASGRLWQDYQSIKNNKKADVKTIQMGVINKFLGKYADTIYNHSWVIQKNNTGVPIWTSDNPIILSNSINNNRPGTLGLQCEGIELYFPLTPHKQMCVVDRSPYEKYISLDYLNDSLSVLTIENIQYLNSSQVAQSYRHIFSNCSDFSFARSVLYEHPELRDEERPRIWPQ